jgi:hypothetical protein
MKTIGSRDSSFRATARWGPGAALSLAVLCGLGTAACSTFPGSTSSWTVESVVERHGYLDVNFSTGGSKQRFFTAATNPCKSMLHAEAVVSYANLGPLGQFQAGNATCIPAGIGSLAAWRDSRPRPQVGPLPSKQANYTLEYQDQDVAMVRGMIPLLGLIAWPGMGDTLVVLPQSPTCQALIPAGVATIQYRDTGPAPYVLLDNRSQCEVAGLIQPTGDR